MRLRAIVEAPDMTDEDFTPIACRACSGNFRIMYESAEGRYKMSVCQWCTRGGQSPSQFSSWQEHRASGIRRRT